MSAIAKLQLQHKLYDNLKDTVSDLIPQLYMHCTTKKNLQSSENV
jgi:hypothetical protein